MKSETASTPRKRHLLSITSAKSSSLLSLVALFLCSFATSASAQWTKINVSGASSTMEGLQVGATQLWAHDTAGNGYEYNSTSNVLEQVTSTPAIGQIAVGLTNSVWCRDTSNQIYFYNFTEKSFEPVTGTLTEVWNGAEGVWGVNGASGHVYKYNGKTNSFDAPPHGEPSEEFELIAVGNYAVGPWALDESHHTWLYDTSTESFEEISGRELTLLSVGNSEVWGVNSSDQVFLYDATTKSWTEPDPSARLTEVAVGSNSNVWGVDASGQVYKSSGTSCCFTLTAQPPEPISKIRVSSASAGVFALAKSGNVYKY